MSTQVAALLALGFAGVTLAIAIAGTLIAGGLHDVAAALRGTWPTRDRVDDDLQQRSAP
jgi:hypothetical protein